MDLKIVLHNWLIRPIDNKEIQFHKNWIVSNWKFEFDLKVNQLKYWKTLSNLKTLIICHKSCNMLSLLNKLTLQYFCDK